MQSVRGMGTQSMNKLVKFCESNRELYESQLAKSEHGKAQLDGKCHSQRLDSVFEITKESTNQQLVEPPPWDGQFDEFCEPQLYQALSEAENNQDDELFEMPTQQQQHERQSNELSDKKNDAASSESFSRFRLPTLQIKPPFDRKAESYAVIMAQPMLCTWIEMAPISGSWTGGIRVVNWNSFQLPKEPADFMEIYKIIANSYDEMPCTNHYIFERHSEHSISKNPVAALRKYQIDACLITMLHERKANFTAYNMKTTAMGKLFKLYVASEVGWCRGRVNDILTSPQVNGTRSYTNKKINFRIDIDDEQIKRYNKSADWIKEMYGRTLLQAATVYTLRIKKPSKL